MEEENYFVVIPYWVLVSEELNANEKILYGVISSLTKKNGFCYASNSYLADVMKMHPASVSRCVNHMKELGVISLDYIYGKGKECEERRIYLKETEHLLVKKPVCISQEVIKSTLCEKKEKVSKHKYGEYKNVLLTEKELDTLCNELGEEKAKGVIKHFSELKEMKGYKYKSDYLALRKWGIRAYEDTHGNSNVRSNEGYF